MSALTDLRAQAAQAACFKCLPADVAQAVKTYLLAVIAGGSVDPKTLLSQARGFFAIPSGMLPAVQATLSATLAGTTVPGLISQSPCAAICQTADDSLAIQIRSLAVKAGGSTDPKTLAKLAACFVCIPTGRQASVQAFLMAVIAGVVPAPPAIPAGQTGPAPTGPPPTIPQIILKTAIKQFALPPKNLQVIIGDAIFVYAGGGTGVKPGTPTGFSFTLSADHSIINVSWDVPPAGVTSTELWTSSDNITFVFEATLNAPAASTTSAAPAVGNTRYGKIRWCNIGGCGSFTAVQSVTNGFDTNLPKTLPGLKFWIHPLSGIFKDAAKTQPCADGDLVNTWADANGFADFVQLVAGNQPIYRANKLNGFAAVEFGANVNTTLVSTHANIAQDYSLHLVIKANSLAAQVAIFCAGSVGPNFGQIAVNPNDYDPYLYDGNPVTTAMPLNANTFYYWSATFNGASSLWSANGIVSNPVGNIGANGIQSTAIAGAGGFSPVQLSCEFMLYKPAITPANQLLLEAYFRAKYGLP